MKICNFGRQTEIITDILFIMLIKSDVQQVKQRYGIIGNTPALNRAIDVALQVAPTDLSAKITNLHSISYNECCLISYFFALYVF